MTDAVTERPPRPPRSPRPRGRKRRILKQFLTFGTVGASGFVVNQCVMVLSNRITRAVWGFDQYSPFVNLFGSAFHVRWYHVFSVLAFIVANIWNFFLNRKFTFRTRRGTPWLRPMFSFMLVGVFGLLITLVVQTALVNDDSPIALSREIWDDSSGVRTRAYWGNFIGVIVAIPANFLFNKLWTFRHRPGKGEVRVASVG
ncbi:MULTISPECIES: GtrA family protein [Corynebacterium]|uniref:GtrA/DPMS transmembrane domain-containing protein n=1 Tax=Corynebacterium provencense TaxID=1737425 RepID=A0A2Z3YXU2_9CORY|nr:MULTISPECIES: GtrA family protein [Corynebacterium]AWT27344.1 hypothetical protein Csp1_26000 [Corynebacterium provencense]MCI1256928.1 GtrA family protein [Corynebacterium provencense]